MSSGSGSLQFVGEFVGEGKDAFEATSRGLGPNPSTPKSGQRWSLCQAARRLLHESSGEEGDKWEEGSSRDQGVPHTVARRVPPGTKGCCPSGSD
ncbi:UNVERIFIED_CONTAM: hypothetical protein Sradi_6461300 [Sesamum radiatum]|uniref:Uncharacterized protein n=1 Tax=Sesamum radiatum TaxID=300843 RepID=A0AAW2K5A9_SESRA